MLFIIFRKPGMRALNKIFSVKKNSFLLLFLMAILTPNLCFTFQKVSTKVKVYDEIFFTQDGLLPLPNNAVELTRELTIKSSHFQFPLKLAVDAEGNIYACCAKSGLVLKFNSRGEFLLSLGRDKKGKELWPSPAAIKATKNQLIIYDNDQQQLIFADFQGAYIKKKKMSDFSDFALGKNGCLYVAHHILGKNSPLITGYFSERKKISFGQPLPFPHSLPLLNSLSLALNEKDELFVAFTYFPIVRKYSPGGKLLAEYRINSPLMEAKEKYNLKLIGAGIADVNRRVGYKPIIISVKTFKDKVYLLSHYPYLEITEIDGLGNCTAVYWIDINEAYTSHDLVIQEIDGELKFYVSHSSPPDYEIDVFKKKNHRGHSPEEEIERWTEEIASSPDYYVAYINRGVAKHRLGRYQSALEDFSRAISLAPDSSLAYYNRGLSRSKIGDLVGAIADFTKAIEIDPQQPLYFYNRGIVLALKKEFAKAIKDFQKCSSLDQKMAAKVQEKIKYCRDRLKK